MDNAADPITPAHRSGYRLRWVWLALAIVLAHALTPLPPSLQARSGSAFSAFTSDVTLGPVRGQDPAKARSGANDRDRQLHLSGGGDLAALPAAAARSRSATLTIPTGRSTAVGHRGQDRPRSHDARAPPRA